jgi:sugar lactone lactonase YvrE
MTTFLAAAAMCSLGGCGGDSAGPGTAGQPLRTTAILGEIGNSPGQFVMPRALDSEGGDLWVIDKSARVQRLDPATGRCTALWTMPDYLRGKPTGITVGPAPVGIEKGPVLYVADTHSHRVMIYRPPASVEEPPQLLGSFGSYGEGPGEFIYLTDVAIVPSVDGRHAERIYVSEYGGNDRISVYDGNLKFLFSFGELGVGPEQFNRPQSLAVDPQRRQLYVTDSSNHRIGVFTLEGKLVRWYGSPESSGAGPEQLCYPYGIALLGDGTALVTEYGNHRVRHMDMDSGETLGLFGVPGTGKGELSVPWAITVVGQTAYVLDSGNARIQAFPAPKRRRTAGTASREVTG